MKSGKLVDFLTRFRIPQIVLGLAAIGLMLRTPRFFTPGTLAGILSNAGPIGILAVGQAFVLIAGGFDLSQGAVVGLCAAIAAWLGLQGLPEPVTIGLVLALGAAIGAGNGWFVAFLRTNPFVTTLSTLLIIRGATFSLLKGERLSDDDAFSWLNHGIPIERILLPTRAVLFPILAVLAWILLRRTIFGQHVYAVGGNEEASRLAGIRTRAVKVAAFAVSGFTAAVVAIQLLAYLRVAKPDTGTGYELDSIASCVVGGISLQGGSGSIAQAVFGCLLLQVLTTLITMSGFPDEYRTPVTGAVILTFAATDALSRRENSR